MATDKFIKNESGKYIVRNLKYVSGGVDCEVQHSEWGWIPFTATENDPESYGRAIYTQLVNEHTADIGALDTEKIEDEKRYSIRSQRHTLLSDSDWTVMPDSPLTTDKKAEWATYRQALRDIPAQSGFPNDITWPTAP
tara:strand:- start:49 stop:462 length:414 start_codon:yes stop_codon:yes gene_type:complete